MNNTKEAKGAESDRRKNQQAEKHVSEKIQVKKKTKHAHQDNKQRRRKTTQKKNKANDEDTQYGEI